MTDLNQYEQAAKNVIDDLIKAGTSFDIKALDQIYHDSLSVMFIDTNGQVNLMNKKETKELFEKKRADGSAHLNTWARYDLISANEQSAHILISRKVNLTGSEQSITLSIDLLYTDQRWQVMREVIFVSAE